MAQNKFDPDKFLAETEPVSKKSDFDPDAFLAETETPTVQRSRPGQAFLESAGNALTAGYLPQIQAGAEKLLQPVYEQITGQDLGPSEPYVNIRDRNIKRISELGQENPYSSLAGTVSGAMLMPGAGSLKAASTAGKIGKAALAGGALGAIYNPGDVEGEVSGVQLGDRTKNALIGAGTGALAQGLLSGAEKAASSWSNKGSEMIKKSYKRAVQALGAKTGDLKKVYAKGDMDRIGKFALDEGFVRPGSTVETIAEKANQYMDDIGPKIGQVYSKVDEAVTNPKFLDEIGDSGKKILAKSELNAKNIANEALEKVKKTWAGKAGGKSAINRVAQELEALGELGENAAIQDLHAYRKSLDDLINFDKAVKDSPPAQKGLIELRRIIVDKIENRIKALETVGTGKGFDDLLSGLKDLNQKFRSSADIKDIASKALAREESKIGGTLPLPGFYDTVLGAGIGASQYDPNDPATSLAKGLAGAYAVKYGRKYGPGALAPLQRSLGGLLQKDPTGKIGRSLAEGLSEITPGNTGVIAESVRRRLKKEK